MDEHTLTAPSDISAGARIGHRAAPGAPGADGGVAAAAICGSLRRGGPAADLAEAVGQHDELLGRQDVEEQFADQGDVAGGGLLLELSRASASSVMGSSPSGAAASGTRISYCGWTSRRSGHPGLSGPRTYAGRGVEAACGTGGADRRGNGENVGGRIYLGERDQSGRDYAGTEQMRVCTARPADAHRR